MMKKLIIGTILIAIYFNSNGQIKFETSIEAGYYNHSYSLSETSLIQTNNKSIQKDDNFMFISDQLNRQSNLIRQEYSSHMYFDINLSFEYKGFNFEQQIFNISTYKGEGHTLFPLDMLFKSRFFYEKGIFQLGVEHMCSHPIINNHFEFERTDYRASHDKIFLKVTFGNK